jgi:hypothetical protein
MNVKHKKGDQLNIADELGWKYYYGHVNSLDECDFFDDLHEQYTTPVFIHEYGRFIPSHGDYETMLIEVTETKGRGVFPYTIIKEKGNVFS